MALKVHLCSSFSMRVLLVDDDSLTIKIGRRVMERLGWVVIAASNGRQAVEAVQGDSVDLVLMDGRMPVMNGADAIRAIRQIPGAPGQVPIVCTSTCEDMMEQCREAGADAFIQKPLDAVAIRIAIGQAAPELGQRIAVHPLDAV